MSHEPAHHPHEDEARQLSEDVQSLKKLGYAQELRRRLGTFSNYAISLSVICILSGGITSFHLALSGAGAASVTLGWPLVALFSLIVAMTMGQVASAFPTAGGLYHWSSILGGRGCGWFTAWFNLAGLVTVLAAINVGTCRFALQTLGPWLGYDRSGASAETAFLVQLGLVVLITASQAAFNHAGIRATTWITDISGYLIVVVAAALTIGLLWYSPSHDISRWIRFDNFSGEAGANVWPRSESLVWLFALGFLLPAYTITGFDASAHASEETLSAPLSVPRGIVRSVAVSGVAGTIMLAAIVLAAPSIPEAAAKGDAAVTWIIESVLPQGLTRILYVGIVAAQYACGLATVTSASRMAYAFARDGGLPASGWLKEVNLHTRTPAHAIWAVSFAAIVFTLYTPVYETITAVCTIFLYISYIIPTGLGAWAYKRSWKRMGPWTLGAWYRPLAFLGACGCLALLVISVQPPNEKALWILGGFTLVLTAFWIGGVRSRFPGPPHLDAL